LARRAERIAAEQTKLLYTQSREGFVATLVNTLIVTLFLGRVVAPVVLGSWLAVMVGVTIARFILVRRYHQAATAAEQAERWRRWFILGAGGAGLGWGAAAWCLFSPDSFSHQLFLTFIIAGMAMGAVVVLSSVMQAFVAFALPALTPLIGRLLWQGDEWGIVIGLLSGIFLAVLLAMSRRLFTSITESLALRFDNFELIDELSAKERHLAVANAALRAEVVEHTRTEEELRAARDELEARVQARTAELTHLNAALQDSERNYRLLLEQAADGIIITDRQGKHLTVNAAACEMLGYTEEELLRLWSQNLIVAGHLEPVPFRLEELWSGKTIRTERQLQRKDGTGFWAEVSGKQLSDGRLQGIIRDITVRKHAETAVQESEEHLRVALEAARMGTWEWNILTDEVKWSGNMAGLFGLAPGAFDGVYATFLNAVHAEDRARVSQAIACAVTEKTPYDIEFRVVWPNGTIRWAASKGQVFRDAVGKAVRMAGVDLDITERKRLKDESHAQTAKLRLLINSLPAFISYINTDQRYQLVNREYEDWFLRSKEQIEGQLVRDLQPAAAYQTIQPYLEKALAGEQIRYEYLVQDSGGESHYFDIVYVPHRAEDGAVLGCFVLVSDITERKQAEAELRRAKERAEAANQAKSDFLATMSHELRTPLNVIFGYAEMLLDSGCGSLAPDQVKVLQRIDQSAHQLFDLISMVLELNRLDAGRLPVTLTNVSVILLLRELAAETQEIQDRSELTIEWRIPASLPPLYTDRGKLKVVLKNLVGNAIKFTPSGSVIVEAQEQEGGVVLSVIDTGIGIPPDALSSIFEAFRQVDGSQQGSTNGVGLGLHIVRRFVDMLGGAITVESAVGQGSTFRVWIPIIIESAPSLGQK
jgi:PAS domain S-box-containing protein